MSQRVAALARRAVRDRPLACSPQHAGTSGAARAHEGGSGKRCRHVSAAAAQAPRTALPRLQRAHQQRGHAVDQQGPQPLIRLDVERVRAGLMQRNVPQERAPYALQTQAPCVGVCLRTACRIASRLSSHMRMRCQTVRHSTLHYGCAAWRTADGQALLHDPDQEVVAGSAGEGLQVHGTWPVAARATEKPLIQMRCVVQELQQATSNGHCRLTVRAVGGCNVGRCAPDKRPGKYFCHVPCTPALTC